MITCVDLNDIVINVTDWDSKFCVAPITKEQFFFWIKGFFGQKIPFGYDNCDGHSYPLDAMWEAYAEITPLSIWYANRSGGKTYDLSILAFMESIFKKNCGCNVLGGSLDQAQKAIAYLTDFWNFDFAPRHMLINKQVAGRGYKLTNGSWVRALAASSRSVRGSHQPKLRIDECLDENTIIKTISGYKKIKDINPNDIVFGWNGCEIKNGMVQYNKYVGVRPTYKIKFSNGKTMYCTFNHKILTTKGYKYLYEIERRKCSGETIFVIGETKNMFDLWRKIKIKKKIYYRILQKMLYKIKFCSKKILFKLRYRDNNIVDKMPQLLSTRKKRKKVKMHRLWKRIAATSIYKMQKMLFNSFIKYWHGFKNGCGKSNGLKKESIKGRNSNNGIIRYFKNFIRVSNSIQKISIRFFMQRFKFNYRGSRRLLARQAKSKRERQAKRTIIIEKWVQLFRIKNKRYSSLVFKNYRIYKVEKIEKDILRPVYDLTIKDLHSYIAEGIIVHNCDELDEKVYLSALGQPKTMNGIPENIIISSTLHNSFGLMSNIIDNRQETGAKLFKWCVREVEKPNGFWESSEIETKRRQITKAMFDSEYLCLRPKIGDAIFDFDSVDRAYNRGMYDVINKGSIIEAGIDWGYSCTILNLIEDTRNMYKNAKSFQFEYIELNDRCQKIVDICLEYNVSKVYCDSNPKDCNITLSKTLKDRGCQTILIPIAFNKWKDIGINILRFLLEKNLFNITDKICQDKCKKYHYKNADLGIIAKEDDHYPDSLIAWAGSKYDLLGYNVDKNKKK